MLNLKMPVTVLLVTVGLALSAGEARAQTPDAAGTYTLTQVNGQALPVVIEMGENCQEEVLSGTLTLEADGDWEFRYVERETCGTEVEEDDEGEGGDYSVEGQSVRFSDDTEEFDANDLDIEELGVGTLSAEGLTVTLQDGQTTLTFTR